jgi:hypothetical protein
MTKRIFFDLNVQNDLFTSSLNHFDKLSNIKKLVDHSDKNRNFIIGCINTNKWNPTTGTGNGLYLYGTNGWAKPYGTYPKESMWFRNLFTKEEIWEETKAIYVEKLPGLGFINEHFWNSVLTFFVSKESTDELEFIFFGNSKTIIQSLNNFKLLRENKELSFFEGFKTTKIHLKVVEDAIVGGMKDFVFECSEKEEVVFSLIKTEDIVETKSKKTVKKKKGSEDAEQQE